MSYLISYLLRAMPSSLEEITLVVGSLDDVTLLDEFLPTTRSDRGWSQSVSSPAYSTCVLSGMNFLATIYMAYFPVA